MSALYQSLSLVRQHSLPTTDIRLGNRCYDWRDDGNTYATVFTYIDQKSSLTPDSFFHISRSMGSPNQCIANASYYQTCRCERSRCRCRGGIPRRKFFPSL